MRRNISQFKVWEEPTKQSKYWANYADENILLLTHPHVKHWVDLTSYPIDHVISASPSLSGKRTILSDILQSSGNVRTVDSEYIYWKLKAGGEVQALAIENLNVGVANPGIQGTEFTIKLDVEYFVPGDIICPDVAKQYQVTVQYLPVADGSGYIYTVQFNGPLDQAYPSELLDAGLHWIKIDSAFGEGSEGYGSTIFQGMSWIEFTTTMGDYGKSVEVTNKAHNMNLRVSAYDDKDRKLEEYPDQIISYIEAEFLAQVKWEKELRRWFGRSAGKHIMDNTVGTHRRIAPGVLEFMEKGNRFEYPISGLTIDRFTQFLNRLAFDRVPYNERNYVLISGQGGITEFSKLLNKEFSTTTVKADFSAFVSPGTSFDPANYKGYKLNTGHFTEFAMFPFGSVKIVHWPILDSTYLNGGILHPITGLPLSSYEYFILDLGFGNAGKGNIELLKLRDAEFYNYVCGQWSPRGPINSRDGRGGAFTATGPQRRYQLFYGSTEGVRVKDIMLMAHFAPAVTA
jgi:hypothetical protein